MDIQQIVNELNYLEEKGNWSDYELQRVNELELMFSAIKLKLVELENPYINEQPYRRRPDDNALNTKYLIPDSDESILSLLKEAKTYKAND